MLQNYPPRILRVFTAAGIYTDEQVLLNLDRLEELGLRSTDARRVRAKVTATAAQGNSSLPVDGETEAVGGALTELPARGGWRRGIRRCGVVDRAASCRFSAIASAHGGQLVHLGPHQSGEAR